MGVSNLFELFSDNKQSPLKNLHKKKVAIDLECTIERALTKFAANTKENLQVVFKQILQLKLSTAGVIVILDGLYKPNKLRNHKSGYAMKEKLFNDLVLESKSHTHSCNQQQKYGCLSSYNALKNSSRYSAILKLLDILGIEYVFNCSEAELLCSKLNRAGIVDVIASEDSDTLIFGGLSIMRNYKNVGKNNKFADTGFVYEYNEVTENKFGFFLVAALLLGGDYATGVDGVGISRIKKLYKNEEFLNVCSKLTELKNSYNFECNYNKWVVNFKDFIKEQGPAIFSKNNNFVKNIDLIEFPNAADVYKYRFTTSLDVRNFKICFSSSSEIYSNSEAMDEFLSTFSLDQLFQLELLDKMKRELESSSTLEWIENFKIVKEYDSSDKDGPGYFIRFKNFFITESKTKNIIEEHTNKLVYNVEQSPRKRVRQSPTRKEKISYPYEIRLSKVRVWDDLWQMVEEWDIRKDSQTLIEGSPTKKLKLSPTKQQSTLFSLVNSPIRKKISSQDDFIAQHNILNLKANVISLSESDSSDEDSSFEIVEVRSLESSVVKAKQVHILNCKQNTFYGNTRTTIEKQFKTKQNNRYKESFKLEVLNLLSDLKSEEQNCKDDVIVLSD